MNRLFILNQKREFNQRLEAIRDRLYRLAYSWTHSSALADDLTQEALARAWKNLAQLHDPQGFDKWCFKILINCWRNHIRAERQFNDIDDYILPENETPQSLHEQHRLTEQVKQAIASLPQGQRQVVTLVDLEELSYSEVAEILEIPIGTVMSRLCRARRLLVERILEKPSVSFEDHAVLRRIK